MGRKSDQIESYAEALGNFASNINHIEAFEDCKTGKSLLGTVESRAFAMGFATAAYIIAADQFRASFDTPEKALTKGISSYLAWKKSNGADGGDDE